MKPEETRMANTPMEKLPSDLGNVSRASQEMLFFTDLVAKT